MAAAIAWLKEHRRTVVLVALGMIIVMAVSLAVDSTQAVVVAGVASGIIVGVAIASESARKDK